METKNITINAKPFIVGLGDHPSGRGHFITYPFGRNVRADFIKGGSFSDTLKFIEANVVRIELDTDELKALPEYGSEIAKKPIDEFTNTSQGARYSHYYASIQVGNSGSNLYRMALALHIMIHFGVWVLDAEGNFIQPVTFIQEGNEITVIDGVAPFQYSTDGENWQTSNILNLEEIEDATIYVLDSAGTIASALANIPNGNTDSGSPS